jgi:cell division protein FtsB
MIADVEKSEKELFAAQKKIKKQEDEIKRLHKENEALVAQKKGLNEDLQKLIAKR